jgi:hypothetical protein
LITKYFKHYFVETVNASSEGRQACRQTPYEFFTFTVRTTLVQQGVLIESSKANEEEGG